MPPSKPVGQPWPADVVPGRRYNAPLPKIAPKPHAVRQVPNAPVAEMATDPHPTLAEECWRGREE